MEGSTDSVVLNLLGLCELNVTPGQLRHWAAFADRQPLLGAVVIRKVEMSQTPYEVISLYLKYEKLLKGTLTSLQKDELQRQRYLELQDIHWEIEVSDIRDHKGIFILEGKVRVPELRNPECPVTAFFGNEHFRDRLLQLNPGQQVVIEGRATCDRITEGDTGYFSILDARPSD